MSEKDDGGSAFPRTAAFTPNGRTGSTEQDGMSLRDWFAGQALAGLISSPNNLTDSTGRTPRVITREAFADAAYLMADAMLAERSKP